MPIKLSLLPLFVLTGYASADSINTLNETYCSYRQEQRVVTGSSLYHGQVSFAAQKSEYGYRLIDCNRQIFTLNAGQLTDLELARPFISSDGHFDSEAMRAAVSVHWATLAFYDFLESEFNWKGYDNNFAPLRQYVHYGEKYFNAQFDKGIAIYGDGGAFNSTPIVSYDYIGHELSHGITSSTAALRYKNESGALNESFSDIIAKAFEIMTSQKEGVSWEMFSDIYRDPGMATRSMSHPDTTPVDRSNPLTFIAQRSAKGMKTVLQQQPKYYRGPLWHTDSSDFGGVHVNSGVQNYWFYLLAEGGTGTNHLNHHYSVPGIGIEKALHIAWRNLTVYLSESSEYMDARYGSEQAAIDLFGENSRELQSVKQAWDAVAVTVENLSTSPRVDENFTGITYQSDKKSTPVTAHKFDEIERSYGPVSKWLIHSSSNVLDYESLIAYQNWQYAGGQRYEIRFTKEGSVALFEDATGTVGKARVPFELWMTRHSDTTSDYVRLIPVIFDVDKDMAFGLISEDNSPYNYRLDHPVSPGEDDPWTDMIHFVAPMDMSAGDAGYRAFIEGKDNSMGQRHLEWIALVSVDAGLPPHASELPPSGSVFRIDTSTRMLPPKSYNRPAAVYE